MPVFLFTDIENSTRLWERFGEAMGAVLERHDALLAAGVEEYGGRVVKYLGDGVFAAFRGGDPLGCALELQRRLAAEDWGDIGELRVRVALHAGEAEERGGDFFGPAVNRAMRLLGVGWGGQTLLTPEAVAAAALPADAVLDDLGVHPLKDLSEPQPIYQLADAASPRKFPPLRSLAGRPHNLPPQPTPFVGREEELRTLAALLAEPGTRLLTLSGPGGVGKTRLALQAAADAIDRFQWGVYFVPLAPLSSPAQAAAAVADALRFSLLGRRRPEEELLDYVREKDLLLLLDNFEHVIAGADFVAELLAAAPQLKVLATSRERLNLRSERVYEVRGLPFPVEDDGDDFGSYPAVQLFVQGARRVRADFALTPADHPHLLRVCRLVEGIPLGLELASSWVRVLTVAETAVEIAADLDFLATDLRDIPERHRSLRTVFDYSWALLPPEEQAALTRLTVFRGGFRREAALAVAAAPLPLLSALADKSLLTVGGEGRYAISEVVRQFAGGKLAADGKTHAATRDKHAAYVAAFLEKWEMPLGRGDQPTAVREIGREIENVREAWAWATERGNAAALGQSLHSLFLFYDTRGWFGEGAEVFARAAEKMATVAAADAAGAAADVRARLRARCGWFYYRLYDYARAFEWLDGARAYFRAAGLACEEALTLGWLGAHAHRTGAYDEADRYYEAALELHERRRDRIGVADVLERQGNVAFRRGEYARAKQRYEEALASNRELGNRRGSANCLSNLGDVANALGDFAVAKTLCEESLAIQREIGFPIGVAGALNNLGDVARAQGYYDRAEGYYREALALQREIGNRWGMGLAMENLGHLAFDRGDYDGATANYAESLALRETIGDRRGYAAAQCALGEVAFSRGSYGEARARYEESLTLQRTLGDRAGVAATLNQLGNLALKTGSFEEAQRLYRESMDGWRELGDRRGIATVLDDMGNAAHALGQYDAARRLYDESIRLSREIGYKRGISYGLNNLGDLHESTGEYDAAEELYNESMELDCESGDRKGIAISLNNLGAIHLAQGRYAETTELCQKGLALSRELGYREGEVFCLTNLYRAAAAEDDAPAAARYVNEALRTTLALGSQPLVVEILIEAAALRAAAGDDETAYLLLTFAAAHPAAEDAHRARAQTLAEEVVARLEPARAAQARDAARDLRLADAAAVCLADDA